MLNRCEFIGNLGADPDIKTIQSSGKKLANLSLAVTEKWKDADGNRQERTEWVRLNCFRDGLCGVIESYLKKGSKIYVAGKMATRTWDDQNGQKRYSTEINIDQLVMLDGRSDSQDNQGQSGGGNYGSASQGEQSRGGQGGNFNNDMDDDIPF